MHSFQYKSGRLHCENVDLGKLAGDAGTPLYVYSASTIEDHFGRLDAAFSDIDHLICYAVKANSNIAVLNVLARRDSGFDIVSGGELYRVIKAGGDPARCTFAGVGKSRAEIEYALKEGILSFNVESEPELRLIDEVARAAKRTAPVALRVNPDVEAKTHKYISTGRSENKFGIGLDRVRDLYAVAAKMRNIRIRGVQMHIGSQITDAKPFAEAVRKMAPLVADLKRAHGIEFFSIGGGLGIVYQTSLASGPREWWDKRGGQPLSIARYAAAVLREVKPLGLRILLEPGRLMVGNAGVLLTRVLYVKKAAAKTFVIVDAGMNDLIRPALYESFHEIVPVRRAAPSAKHAKVDVVGPVCESGDFFAQDRPLPPLREGDLLALMSAGAYGFVMASNYNSRPLPAEILVRGRKADVIRERQTVKDLVRGERIP
jgi:diaminopimelate decarboxylase